MERIGEIRCHTCSVMALTATATATRQLRIAVSAILGMQHPEVIAVSPCKPNLVYGVGTYTSVEATFSPLLDRLKKIVWSFQGP